MSDSPVIVEYAACTPTHLEVMPITTAKGRTMAKRYDLTGQKFGRLTVLSLAGQHNSHVAWSCRCDCGNEINALGSDMRFGKKMSCGCLHRDRAAKMGKKCKTHGLSDTRTNNSWSSVQNRCCCKTSVHYMRYGGRGIMVCEYIRRSPANLVSVIGERPENTSIDRIDGTLGYTCGKCPDCKSNNWNLNVRWADRKTQARNRACMVQYEFLGEKKYAPDWSEIFGVSAKTVKAWSAESIAPMELVTRISNSFRKKLAIKCTH